jgi:hypothetical protein
MNKVSCICCKKEYSPSGIFTHFLHSHDIQWRESWYESNKENHKKGTAGQEKKREIRKELYRSNPTMCYCGKELSWDKRRNLFCSKSCAASKNNSNRGPASIAQKEKTSNSIKEYIKNNKQEFLSRSAKHKSHTNVIFHKCTQCDNIVLSRGKKISRKTCSRECQIHASVGCRKYTNGRRLNIYYTDKNGESILLESSWELKMAEMLDHLDIKWERPKPIKYIMDGKTRLYYPDFYLTDYNLFLDPKNNTALSLSLDKMNIVSKLINLWYGDIQPMLEEIPSVRAAGFEPATRIFAPAPKAGGMSQANRRSD